MKIKPLLLFIFIFLISGCVPWSYDYYSPQAKNGELIHKGPSLIGSRNTIVLKKSSFEIQIRYIDYIQIQVFVPEGKELYIKNSFLYAKNIQITLSEKHYVKFKKFNESNYTNKLIGYKRTNFLQRKGTHYYAKIELDNTSEEFTIILPVFETKSNQTIKFNDVTFTEKTGVAIMPLNG